MVPTGRLLQLVQYVCLAHLLAAMVLAGVVALHGEAVGPIGLLDSMMIMLIAVPASLLGFCVATLLWVRGQRRALKRMRCVVCGYDLRRLSTTLCPECGADQRKSSADEVLPLQLAAPSAHPALLAARWRWVLTLMYSGAVGWLMVCGLWTVVATGTQHRGTAVPLATSVSILAGHTALLALAAGMRRRVLHTATADGSFVTLAGLFETGALVSIFLSLALLLPAARLLAGG